MCNIYLYVKNYHFSHYSVFEASNVNKKIQRLDHTAVFESLL